MVGRPSNVRGQIHTLDIDIHKAWFRFIFVYILDDFCIISALVGIQSLEDLISECLFQIENSFKELGTLLGFLFPFFLNSFKYIITEKDLLTGLGRFLHPNKKQILQPNNHLMARMFRFHKEAMDLDVESACS